jgi:chromosome partitioning protein
MGKVFVFVNQKGGVGKTTSAVNLGAYLAEAGKTVLLVDFDAQANLSSGVGAKPPKPGIYELLSGAAGADQVIRKTAIERLHVIPASIDLSGAAVELIEQEDRDFFLKKALAPLRGRYDYILIDCPPSLGVLTLNGMAAADAVLIPMQCEYFAMEGLTMLLQTVKRIQQNLNPRLTIGGIFFTMYDPRTRLAQDVVKKVSAYFKTSVFSTIIPRNVRLSEAPSHGQPISLYDPQCSGARAYQSLAQEVLKRSAAVKPDAEAVHGA